MPQTSIPDGRPERLVPCPECGRGFVRRGLAAHRRMRHGATAATASDLRPVNETLACLRRVLESLAGVLERMDARLVRIESARAQEPVAPGTGALERGITEVLAEITRVKEETDRQLEAWGGRARTQEQKDLEQTAFFRIATLRKRQASLVYRLREFQAVESSDAACL